MFTPRANIAELNDLEQRQDEVIRKLDDLIQRLDRTLADCTVIRGQAPAPAVVKFPSPADEQHLPEECRRNAA